MKHSTYHSILRISALTLALILLFDSGLLNPVTRNLSQNTQGYLASVIGMNASVVPTELNKYTAELTQRDRLLTQRENDVAAREIKVNIENGSGKEPISTYLLSSVLFVILVLIVLNYTLDYTRARTQVVQYKNEKTV